MAFKNNVMIVRHELLANLVKLWNEDSLVEKIDRIPLEKSPRHKKVRGRCCVHKERAVLKYKLFPLLGFDMDDEEDELAPLSHYADIKLNSKKPIKDNLMCVIDEACSSCVQVNYVITDLCRGCVARNCYMNCPKDAIYFNSDGRAKIDHDKCVSCGLCHKGCQYHAIVYVPVPCEEVCPVGAISKDEYGVEHIDETKCIYCGKCLNACPFGAIFEISQTFDILQSLHKNEELVALVAPAVLGQFGVPVENVLGAIKAMGFKDIIEVAQGAMVTTANESKELLEKLDEGQNFMTTSCCPSYVELVEKHLPQMKKYVSSTKSPMYYTAKMAKEQYPDAKLVFVGPCIGKRKEVKDNNDIDYILTFEELSSVFDGLQVDLTTVKPFVINKHASLDAYGYAKAGGVAASVKAALKVDVEALQVSNLNKKNVNLLRIFAKTGKSSSKLIEVMACENGCISGPCIYKDRSSAQIQYNKEMAARKKILINK